MKNKLLRKFYLLWCLRGRDLIQINLYFVFQKSLNYASFVLLCRRTVTSMISPTSFISPWRNERSYACISCTIFEIFFTFLYLVSQVRPFSTSLVLHLVIIPVLTFSVHIMQDYSIVYNRIPALAVNGPHFNMLGS